MFKILIIVNPLSDVQSDTQILQIITQEKLQKLTKVFQKDLILKTKSPVKIRDIHKIEKTNSVGINVFGYEKKKKTSHLHIKKKYCEEKHVDLLLTEEEGKRYYVLMKDVNTFMYNHT